MDPVIPDEPTPDALLDAIRDHPEWSDPQRDAGFSRLIAGFSPSELIEAASRRLGQLGGPDGSYVLRLVETFATPALLASLVSSMAEGPDLPAERQYEALAILDGFGALEDEPELAEHWAELNELLNDDTASLEELAAQLEEEPEGSWVALQGLEAVEPEVRAEILEGLTHGPIGPGVIAFLRLLAFAEDRITRTAALAALENVAGDDPASRAAWESLAADHPDPNVMMLAKSRLPVAPGETLPVRSAPRLREARVTAVDGDGLARVVLVAEDQGRPLACALTCDVLRGVIEVQGREDDIEGWASEVVGSESGRDVVSNRPDLAMGLLAGSLLLRGEQTPPSLRYWLEKTVGPGFRARPFAADFGGIDPSAIPPAELPGRAEAVLEACPDWADRSSLLKGLAEEIELREGGAGADPRRDAGAYRYLFEHQLQGELERYRRMLLWMAAFWRASEREELAESAFSLGWRLSDPQYAVPGNAFLVALTTRSLNAAREAIRGGVGDAGERGSES